MVVPGSKKAYEKAAAPFEERAAKCSNPLAKRIMEIAAAKKTNLCVAIDLASAEGVLDLAAKVGPLVCCVKTHADATGDWDASAADKLKYVV